MERRSSVEIGIGFQDIGFEDMDGGNGNRYGVDGGGTDPAAEAASPRAA